MNAIMGKLLNCGGRILKKGSFFLALKGLKGRNITAQGNALGKTLQ